MVFIFQKVIQGVQEFRRDYRDYLRDGCQDARAYNISLLQKVNILYLIILIGYFFMAYYVFQSPALNLIYIIFILIQLIYFLAVIFILKKKEISYKKVQFLCILFDILLMMFIITVSIFPYTDRPAIYFPMMLVGFIVLFVLPLHTMLVMVTGFEIIFIIMVSIFKTPDSLSYDLFASVAAYILSIVCAYILCDLRLREHRAKVRLEQLSAIDDLTGVLNKRAVENMCNVYLLQKPVHEHCALFVIDLDNFKQINDTEGHLKGDEVLKEVGQILRRIFHTECIIGRMGGDEFVVMMKNIPSNDFVKDRAIELNWALSKDLSASTLTNDSLCCSTGVVIGQTNKLSYKLLCEQADQAMYISKKEGKNRYTIVSSVDFDKQ